MFICIKKCKCLSRMEHLTRINGRTAGVKEYDILAFLTPQYVLSDGTVMPLYITRNVDVTIWKVMSTTMSFPDRMNGNYFFYCSVLGELPVKMVIPWAMSLMFTKLNLRNLIRTRF